MHRALDVGLLLDLQFVVVDLAANLDPEVVPPVLAWAAANVDPSLDQVRRRKFHLRFWGRDRRLWLVIAMISLS